MTDRPNNQDAGITEPAHPSDDELSAYLNRDMADLAQRQRLEAHLESCAECRERLAELRTVVRLMRGLESPVPKRSFRLDPSDVSAPLPEPEPLRIDPWIVRVQPALRRLTAIAAVLLVVLVTADVLTHRNASDNGSREVSALSSESQASDSTSVMSEGAAESVPKSTAAAAQVPAATAASGGSSSSSGSSAEAPVTSSASSGQAASTSVAASSATDAARSSETAVPAASAQALIIQQSEASGQPPAEAAPTSNSSTHGGRSSWRLVELAVGVVVIWLLFLTVVLPRLPRQRRS